MGMMLPDILAALKKEYDPEHADDKMLDKLMTPKRPILVDVSRTPFETLYGPDNPEVNYGDPPEPYRVTGWGEDVPCGFGTVPKVVLLIRKDAYEKLVAKGFFGINEHLHAATDASNAAAEMAKKMTAEQEKPKLGKLNWDNWKPAPGFEDFRK